MGAGRGRQQIDYSRYFESSSGGESEEDEQDEKLNKGVSER
jgi:hypothetical protein